MQSSPEENLQLEGIKKQIREYNESTLTCLERCRERAASTLATCEEVDLRLQIQGKSLKKSEAHLDEAGVQTQLASDKIKKIQNLTRKLGINGPSVSGKRRNDCNQNDGESEPRAVGANQFDDPAIYEICHSWSPTHAKGPKYQFEATEEDERMEAEIDRGYIVLLGDAKRIRLGTERVGLQISKQVRLVAEMEHETAVIDEHLRDDRIFLNKLA